MASKSSRLLREGREKDLIQSLVKIRLFREDAIKIAKGYATIRCKVKSILVKNIRLSGRNGELKLEVLYKKHASEVTSETYFASMSELDIHPTTWRQKKREK